MIQRIQTLWLIFASLALFLLFVFPYSHFADQLGIAHSLKITGLYKNVGGENVLVLSNSFIFQTIFLVIIALIPLLIIFNYKNRKRQILMIYLTIVLSILFAVWLYVTSKNVILTVDQVLGIGNLDIGTLLVPLSIVFLLLALKGISNDEKLIKSADRLR